MRLKPMEELLRGRFHSFIGAKEKLQQCWKDIIVPWSQVEARWIGKTFATNGCKNTLLINFKNYFIDFSTLHHSCSFIPLKSITYSFFSGLKMRSVLRICLAQNGAPFPAFCNLKLVSCAISCSYAIKWCMSGYRMKYIFTLAPLHFSGGKRRDFLFLLTFIISHRFGITRQLLAFRNTYEDNVQRSVRAELRLNCNLFAILL